MSEKDVLKLKNSANNIYEVCIKDKYNVIGECSHRNVALAAKFVREKYGEEPKFYCTAGHEWLIDKDGKRYEFVVD